MKRDFHNHIVVLLTANSEDRAFGLGDLVIPMRSSLIPYDELQEVVFLGDSSYLAKEWHFLQNLPKITVVHGSCYNRAVLRAISIKTCAMAVVLSPWNSAAVDPILDDQAAILATLNIQAMPFDVVEGFAAIPSIPVTTVIRTL